MNRSRILTGDSLATLRTLRAQSVQCCVTSPPYWGLRDYGVQGQMGLESTPEAYVGRMVELFREVRRVLKDDGTLWLNLGDSYAAGGSGQNFLDPDGVRPGGGRVSEAGGYGHIKNSRNPRSIGLKPKDLVGIPWRVAFALQADGWYLRSDIIWHKPNPMPESVTDRPTKAHEYLFLLTKAERYYYDAAAIKEQAVNGERFHGGYDKPGVLRMTAARNGRTVKAIARANGTGYYRENGVSGTRGVGPRTDTRNKRTVWTVTPRPFKGAHFATFPPALVEPCILAGSRRGDLVLDPFSGAATTGLVALQHGRRYLGLELNPQYVAMAESRLQQAAPLKKAA